MKILVVDHIHTILVELFQGSGHECDYRPDIRPDEITHALKNYNGIIIRSKIKLTKEIIQQCPDLKFIGRVGAGMENIDTECAENKGIACFNSPEGNRDAVGEHALGMLLCLMNNLFRAHNEVKSGLWKREENRGFEIKGKTIGIIGYGNMGSSFARKLSGFEAEVIAYDKYKSNYSDQYVQETGMDEIFSLTDILSLHVPLTAETHHLVNDEYIRKFKKKIYILNTARGKVVDTGALVKHLNTGKIIGAGLDVLEYESLSFENLHKETLPDDFRYLTQSDKVILSPHIAGWTHESNYKLSEILAEKIIRHFKN